MAKGLRSKVKKRFRTLKREVIRREKERTELLSLSNALKLQSEGKPWRKIEPPNAFLYPNDPNASFPQYKKQPLIDFRNDKIEFAGYEFIGGRKKKLSAELIKAYVRDEIDVEEAGEIPQFQEEGEKGGAEIEEENQIDEDDLAAELEGIKLSSKREQKRNKKKKQMEVEEDALATNSKKIKKKERRGNCKKSRKIMKF